MRLSYSVKTNLLVAAALAGLGLLSAAARHPSRQPSRHPSQPLRRHPATASGSLASLQDELRSVAPRPSAPVSGGAARGREADTPSEIPARGWWDIAKRTASQTSEHRLMTEGAGITFYAILAIFPALAALVSVYGLVADPATVSGQLNALSGIVPGGGMDILGDELKQLVSAGGASSGSVRSLAFSSRCGVPMAAPKRCSTRSTSSMMSMRSGGISGVCTNQPAGRAGAVPPR